MELRIYCVLFLTTAAANNLRRFNRAKRPETPVPD
jgi:hypothetical protein